MGEGLESTTAASLGVAPLRPASAAAVRSMGQLAGAWLVRILVVSAGLLVGAVIGLIVGLMTGLIDIRC